MIHYINGVPTRNVQLNKPKRHALPAYRHAHNRAQLKDFVTRVGFCLLMVAVLASAYLTATN